MRRPLKTISWSSLQLRLWTSSSRPTRKARSAGRRPRAVSTRSCRMRISSAALISRSSGIALGDAMAVILLLRPCPCACRPLAQRLTIAVVGRLSCGERVAPADVFQQRGQRPIDRIGDLGAGHAEILPQGAPGQHVVQIGRKRLGLTDLLRFQMPAERRHRLVMMFNQAPPEAGPRGAADAGQGDGTRQMRMTIETPAQFAKDARQLVRRAERNVPEDVVLDPLAGGGEKLRTRLEMPVDGALGDVGALGNRRHRNVVGGLVLERLDEGGHDPPARQRGVFVALTGALSLNCTHVIVMTSAGLAQQGQILGIYATRVCTPWHRPGRGPTNTQPNSD